MDFSWFPTYAGLFLEAFLLTLRLSAVAILFGTILGLIVGIFLTGKNKAIRFALRIYVELVRGSPLLIQLFMVYFGLPRIGFNITLPLTTFSVFTLYCGGYIAEITRSGIEAIPKGQWEAANCLGLNNMQTLFRIILPQTAKIALPSLIGFYIAMIKDTSLASVIGYSELVKKAQSVMNLVSRPFEVYIVVGLCYFIICYPLSKLVKYIERRNEIK